MSENKPLLIIDGYGFVFRAYHVQPPLTSPDGMPVGAIYGFTSMLIKLLNDFKPERAVVVLDHGGKNFRHEIYPNYKAHRPPVPEDLLMQLPLVKEVALALNFKCISMAGYEADDLIAAIATKSSFSNQKAIVISSDKDLMQLVDSNIAMYDPAKSKYIDQQVILEKFGVAASKVREVLALIGDKSDNIPGVAGIGPKTAASLINEYGSLEQIINNLDKLSNPRYQTLILNNLENAKISWKLVGLDNTVDFGCQLSEFSWQAPAPQNLSNFIERYGFKSLVKRVESLFQLKVAQGEPNKAQTDAVKVNLISVVQIEQINDLLSAVKRNGIIGATYFQENSIHIFCLAAGNSIYKINYAIASKERDLFSVNIENKEINSDVNKMLDQIFKDNSIKKVTYNLKGILKVLSYKPSSFEDLMLMDYLASAGGKAKQLSEIILEYTSKQLSPEFCYQVTGFVECYSELQKRLVADKVMDLYQSIELPICYILDDMEKTGIEVDVAFLNKLSREYGQILTQVEQKIYNICSQEFNISSPKQLGVILFDKLKLPYGKPSGKTKSYSTNSEILEKLSDEGHQIAKLLLEYRHLSKLKNTYLDSLPSQVDPVTKRIHTTFLQSVTSTGRLSSVNPNLQNIPIRTEEGNRVREAFVAPARMKLISADYSQVELRILSHVAAIDDLQKAFEQGKDIHAQTASQIFDIPISQITPDLRRKAKAINFGIIYGISAFGLAKQIGVSQKEAAEYIKCYFAKYPGIEQYMNSTISFARTHGYVVNLLGRRCYLPNINSKDHNLRSFSERAAINAPMQSLTSDIVKIAMIKIYREFEDKGIKAKLVLQIHDELIFECPESDVGVAVDLIRKNMTSAYLLKVDLKTEINSGENWRVIH